VRGNEAGDRRILLSDEPVGSLEAYLSSGGGRGLDEAARLGAAETVESIRASGLRGRGGAGFPTGVKWDGARKAEGRDRYAVCNAAEGEPGTFKDRALIRANPYQVLEGLAIAATAIGASSVYVGIKAKFAIEIARLEQAAAEMGAAGMFGDVALAIVSGPDDYLFGEETALLEVVEGSDPLPRLFPPYVQGLFESRGAINPTVVNNVETLANVPHILANGPGWFRSFGTEDTPGTTVATIGGDVLVESVAELEMGTPLSILVEAVGGGLRPGRKPLMIANGVSNRPLRAAAIDTPMDFASMRALRSGYGSGGFTVYDDTACVVRVAAALSDFLAAASCGQCPPCKLGTAKIAGRFGDLATGRGGAREVEELAAWILRVTDANRCGLGAGQQALARGILEQFPDHVAAHLDGEDCGSTRRVTAPIIEDWDESGERFAYAER
jgi:NADH-quinone oxidoreductase subunit F